MMHDRLDDDDRIVHDDADREHESEERQHVDRKPEHREEDERADERDRHGHQRNQRRAPVLQEDEHHDDDETDSLEEGVLDLHDALGDRQRRIERDEYPYPEGSAASRSSIVCLTRLATSSALVPGI